MIPNRNISVVIPSKEGIHTIDRALSSLACEAAFIREVIVVTSNSSATYRRYCNEKLINRGWPFEVRVVDSGEPSNGSIARNLGINIARGEYLSFLDDDDEALPSRFATFFATLARSNPQCDWTIISRVISCNHDRSEAAMFPKRRYDGGPIAEFILRHGGGAQTNGIFLRTELARRVLFNPSLPRHQDYDFCMSLGERAVTFIFNEQPVAYWYTTGNQFGKGGTFSFCLDWLALNSGRTTPKAIRGYFGKEVFAAARNERLPGRFLVESIRHLGVTGLLAVLAGLTVRIPSYLSRRAGWLRSHWLSTRGRGLLRHW
jgi:glycosyltransferase involved in cell wall biosynthesis